MMKKTIVVVLAILCLELVEDLFGVSFGSVTVSHIVSITDGDTFRVDIDHWPAIIGHSMPVRIADIDCPEMRGPDSLEARNARYFAKAKLQSARTVTLKNISRGKYFRIVAQVYVDSLVLGQLLVDSCGCKPSLR
jgi:endonuclease YncB( thermonuclease family)